MENWSDSDETYCSEYENKILQHQHTISSDLHPSFTTQTTTNAPCETENHQNTQITTQDNKTKKIKPLSLIKNIKEDELNHRIDLVLQQTETFKKKLIKAATAAQNKAKPTNKVVTTVTSFQLTEAEQLHTTAVLAQIADDYMKKFNPSQLLPYN